MSFMNHRIKKLLRAIVDNYIFIGFCAVFYYLSGFIAMGATQSPGFIHVSLIFWSTTAVYHLSANNQIHQIYLRKAPWVLNRGVYVSLVLTGITALHFLFIPVVETLYLSHLALITLLYNIPRSANFYGLPLRGIPMLKIFLIAYVWASLGSIFPALQNAENIFRPPVTRLFMADFSFIMAITLPFDIRDYYSNHLDEPRTLAHLLGLRHTATAALLLLTIFALLIWPLLDAPVFFIPFLIIVLLLIFYSTPHKNKYYYTVLLDGTMILYYFALRSAIR